MGITSDSRRVRPEDLFVALPPAAPGGGDGIDWAVAAFAAGACAVVAERRPEGLPTECPCILVDDALGAAHALSNTFYEWPSRAMSVVGVTGTNGKTTTAWLIRSVLEQLSLVVGMVGTIEYAIAEDRLDEDGDLWMPTENDPTLSRASSAPYHIAPYRGKYAVPHTTPGAVAMTKILAGMRDRGAHAAVLEATSQGLQQGRLTGTDVDVAVFTNLSRDHLDYHGSMESYKRAKLALFEQMAGVAQALRDEMELLETALDEALAAREAGASSPPSSSSDADAASPSADHEEAADLDAEISALEERLADLDNRLAEYLGRKRAVINLDDPYADEFRAAAGEIPVVTYAVNDRDADVVAEKVTKTIWESVIRVRVTLGGVSERLEIVTNQIGGHNVHNVLAAVAAGLALRAPLQAIVVGIEAVDLIPGRMELIDEKQAFPVIVDYAHTPAALGRILDTVKECGAKRVITVFGCGGDRDRGKRPLMGEIAHYKSDIVIFTNDNPRTEDPSDIIAEIVAGLPTEVKDRHAGSVYPWLQDRIRVPAWFEEFLLEYQAEVKRYVIEDRVSAIRMAVGTAVDKARATGWGGGFQGVPPPLLSALLRDVADETYASRCP